MHQFLTIKIFDAEIECISANSTLWFTQKAIAEIFGATKQNVSHHTSDLGHGSSESISTNFTIPRMEGDRRINRNLAHFDIRVLAAIALRSRRYDIHEEVLKVASDHQVLFTEIPIRSKKEWEFGELLIGALRGITPVLEQHKLGAHYADFFLPEFGLVVEFDELHHTRPKQKRLDSTRQSHLEETFGVSFVRIKHTQEIQGLNEVLKSILRQIGPNHSMQRTLPLRGPAADFES